MSPTEEREAIFGQKVVWKDITEGKLIDVIAEEFPDREALVIDGIRKTYAEYLTDINKITYGLIELGVSKGDTVGIMARNIYEWMVSWYALAKIGVYIVPMDYWYKDTEAHFIMHHAEMKAVLCSSEYVPMISSFDDLDHFTDFVLFDKETPLEDPRISYFWAMMDTQLTDEMLEKINEKMDLTKPEDICFILYTSGTTGQPKGAMLTHNNVIGDCMEIARALRAGPDDAYLIPVPFSHCFGNELGITMATLSGAKMVPMKDQTPSVALQAVTDEKCTIIHGTPTHFIRYVRELRENPDKYDVSTLRSGVTAGAVCPPEVMKDIMEVLHVPDIVNAYGQTECSPICSLTRVTDPMDKRLETVGTHIENVEVKIVDDDNNDVALGVVGEICTRGWHVMKGYFKEPERTAETIDEYNWLHTGDLGILDEEGYLQIAGRKKDMVNYGGFKIFPRIVEDFLLTNPQIHEVAVVGIPDPEYGELVAAVAKVEDGFTEQELVDFCFGKISDPSVPRFVRFDVLIPLSGRGKVQKYKLVETLKHMMNEGTLGDKIVPTAILNKKKH